MSARLSIWLVACVCVYVFVCMYTVGCVCLDLILSSFVWLFVYVSDDLCIVCVCSYVCVLVWTHVYLFVC